MRRMFAAVAFTVLAATVGLAQTDTQRDVRNDIIRRAKILLPADVSRHDLKQGPGGPGAFSPNQTVTCEYVDKELSGASPKFACVLPDGDELKVKYAAGTNGEVYGEVAASRLLWALGFPADRMYPVRVICRGCPEHIGSIARANGDRVVDPAVVERKVGTELLSAWHWDDLAMIDESAGGASLAERDALKLLAVFLQHSDSRPQNQRVVCLEPPTGPQEQCRQPFVMIQDLGITFGRANRTTQQPRASVNLAEWAPLPIWKDRDRCIGNLAAAWKGSLAHPVIREAGRRLLSDRMAQLTDAQLRDLFEAARVTLRPRSPSSGRSGFPTVNEWITAFRARQQQIAAHRCPE